jgi:4-hydroxybutyrate CoA-transferase
MIKLVDADTALSHIQSGHQIFVQGAAATPTPLLEALARRAKEVTSVGVVHLHTEGPAPHLDPSLEGHLHHRALFIGPNARAAVDEGRAEYVPVFLSDIPRLFRKRDIPIDVALLNVSPPDAHGFCSLGTSVDVTLAAVERAKLVIAQINPSMPRTHGDGFVHVNRIDWGVAVNRTPYIQPPPELGETERRIGAFVAELVPDEATLQLGIGAIPSAIAMALADKRDLGIHTEMLTDAIIDLVEKGVVTGAKKEVNRGKIVTSFLLGTQRLYDFVHDNPLIEMRSSEYTNDSALIRRFRRMIAVNSALEIDLTGQVCADSIGPRLYSGVGGQMDFIRGAAMAEEGRAIIALPSTAARGTVSRIVPMLKPGAGVVTTRAHVHTVVTEWGVAELHGRGVAERARSLIAIADPRFRDELAHAARERHFLA